MILSCVLGFYSFSFKIEDDDLFCVNILDMVSGIQIHLLFACADSCDIC